MREPSLKVDRWELESAEDRHARTGGRFWIPPLEQRAELKLGDLAHLLFRIQDEGLDGRSEVVVERMWVLVIDVPRAGIYLGRLVNQPDSVNRRHHYLTPGAEVPFHARHVIDIGRWAQPDIVDFLANVPHRKWA